MLDENEYAIAAALYRECLRAAKDLRARYNLPPGAADVNDRFAPLRLWYQGLTGFCESNHNAIMHHRLADLGPPCPTCAKPFRTPRARYCAACGQRR